jgi:hypothetical protein
MYGMGLVVISQMVQAVQLTFEDYFLADLRMAPLQVCRLSHSRTSAEPVGEGGAHRDCATECARRDTGGGL